MAAGDILDYFDLGGGKMCPVIDMMHTKPPASPEVLSVWAVFTNVSDYPGKFVARRNDNVFANGVPEIHVTGWVIVADTLDECRAGLPPGLTRLLVEDPTGRQIENWI